ncbi:MAG: small multi-drug export protein [Marinirhabdus sp.]|nr:small multi-drug export protein [Marinirhabdus sp.]
MIKEIIITILWSLSPFGEAKVGIPYGITNDLNPYFVFVIALAANILVFPIMLFFLKYINSSLLRWRFYKKSAIWVARRAKTGSGDKIKKYGFWGLIFFVSIPLPGTGVYAGTIAAYIFKIERSTAFWANVIGITISSIIVWTTTVLTIQGVA